MTRTRAPREPKHAARRRDDLLEAALLLFNTDGTGAVSTNHIAAAAGISAGNVYYWFPNKAAIVRALFAQWSEASAVDLDGVDEPDAVLLALLGAIRRQVGLTERYGVFARELAPLLHADDELAAQYRENFIARVDRLVQIVELLIEAGLLERPLPPADVRSLVEATWVATEFTPSFLAAMGRPADDDAAVRIIAAPLFAQLTPTGRAVLEADGRTGRD